MKSIIFFILILSFSCVTSAQSTIVFDAGTNIDVGTGADICADIVNINGTYSGSGTLCNGPLPVELSSFTAAVDKNNVCLKWITETEVSNYGFEVERKIVSQYNKTEGAWSKIGFIEGHGNCNSPNTYSFIDEKPFGGSKFQYRLKQIDTDGEFKYSDAVEIEIIPDNYELYQNYPNPFNAVTVIRYQLPKQSEIELKVYDILGAAVADLIKEKKEPGVYEIVFDANQLPSGAYIYRFISDSFIRTKKMILIK